MNDAQALENAVMTGTPSEVAEISKSLDMEEYANRALALACRFRGLAYVKAIVENDRTIKDANKSMANYWLALLDVRYAPYRKKLLAKKNLLRVDELEEDILPAEQRAEIVNYLCGHGEKVLFNADNTLFQYSVICHDRDITAAMRENGAGFTRYNCMFFADPHGIEWHFIFDFWEHLEHDEMFGILQTITAETGHLTRAFISTLFWNCDGHFLYPGLTEFVYEHCYRHSLNKGRLIKGAIDKNSIAHLEMFAQIGWLKHPLMRNEIISYAAETGKTECTAWLLNYINRNSDPEAEHGSA